MIFRTARIVAKKEITDNLRDRRAVLTALTMPLLGPLSFILTLTGVAKTADERSDKRLVVPVIGAELAPRLVQQLETFNIGVQPKGERPAAEPEAVVRSHA